MSSTSVPRFSTDPSGEFPSRTPASADDRVGRVLLVAYYFPPAGGPAVQRILQYVQNLAAYGWEVEVLAPRRGAYPSRDESLLARIPETVRVHRTTTLDPLGFYERLTRSGDGDLPAGSLGDRRPSLFQRLARWVRANLFLPDARVGWWPTAVWKGWSLLRTGRFDALLTSGAPHSVHLVGRSLHRRLAVPWVADLHDPWTDVSYYDEFPHTRCARAIDAHLERTVLAEASAVTTVSPSWSELFAGKARNDYSVVENGFDPADFEGIEADPTGARFTLAHVGKLFSSRNPGALWEVVRDLRTEGELAKLEIRLVGTVAPAVREDLRELGLEAVTSLDGFLPHRDALARMAESTLLLLVIERAEEADGHITSKLYEYLATERPVLGIGPPGGDANRLLRRHGAGEVADWDDRERIRALLLDHYAAWESGSPRVGTAREELGAHTRRTQARRMADVLRWATARAGEDRRLRNA